MKSWKNYKKKVELNMFPIITKLNIKEMLKMNKVTILLVFIGTIIIIFSCTREWNNPFESDEDLKRTPVIAQIQPNTENNLAIFLDYSYSDESKVILERKSLSAFVQISYLKFDQATLIDTSFDKESDYNFTYRVKAEKDGYSTAYSNEKPYNYVSNILYAPENLTSQTLELQGVKLSWIDKSGTEDGYKIEKNENGSGYIAIDSISANSTNYMDNITGMPDPPLSLLYRVKAYNNSKSSAWAEINTNYSGMGSPTNLRITDSSFYNFTIEWDDNSGIETGYSVEWKKDNENYTEIELLNANVTEYSDNISEIGTYYYKIKAVKGNVYSNYSNEVFSNVTSIIPTEGLVAYYPFNGNANDESGNENDGMVNGATLTEDRFGNNDRAYDFDGDDFISIQDNDVFTLGSNPFSFSLWVKFNQIDSYYIMGHDEGGGYNKKWILYFTDLSIGIHERLNGDYWIVNSSWEPNINNWYYLTIIRNINDFSIFIDGSLLVSNNDTRTIPNPDAPILIGNAEGSNKMYKGLIDDIRFYNRALTEEEIQALYHEGGWGK